jgi:hypothetical protein
MSKTQIEQRIAVGGWACFCVSVFAEELKSICTYVCVCVGVCVGEVGGLNSHRSRHDLILGIFWEWLYKGCEISSGRVCY